MRASSLLCAVLCLSVVACASGADTTPDEDLGTSSSALLTTVTPGANKVEGIDVSHYQGTINWASEKAKGRLFGVASVGDGTYQDPTFTTNWNAMKAAGVIRGAYQYFEPGDDPIVQADILIAKIGKLGVGDLPATVDVEVTGGQSAATIASRLGKWLARVEAGTGRKPMIYTGPYFWQGSVVSTAYGSYPMWVADYGVAKPQVPAPWTTFKIWQYSDSGGALDLDRFNGTLAELQAFARPANAAPKGTLEAASCDGIKGWAQDPSAPTKSIGVSLSFDGASGTKTAQVLPTNAATVRNDLSATLGSSNHGFALPIPLGVLDGKAHQLFAYGVDSAGGASTLLTGAPKSFTCPAPAPPLAASAGVKRLVSSAAMTAWKFSALTDVAHLADAQIAAFANGEDLPAKPELAIADDGSPDVWLLEDGKRRHVVSTASEAAWHFAAPAKTTAATLMAMPQGPDWRATPFVMEGMAPALYVLDLLPTAAPGSEGAGDAAPRDGDGMLDDAPPAASGCQLAPITRPRTSSSNALLGAAAIALAIIVKRRRK